MAEQRFIVSQGELDRIENASYWFALGETYKGVFAPWKTIGGIRQGAKSRPGWSQTR
ncbi:hypothetical protein ABYF32_03575 [Buchananella felis]|uniref:hypothetical protein n=1 Tax=Buchananella felis TaxID=3231492 RepID=UPI0035290D9C